MKFGWVARAWDAWSDLVDVARHVASTGWDSLWLPDHLLPPPEEITADPWNEVWTTLAALAATVPRIRLGHLVCSNTFRHPALVAKMAATVDQMSGGRLILGLGAGWLESEHRAYGIALPPLGERLARLDESCAVIRRLLDGSRATYSGRYYELRDAPLEPKPVQKRLPLLVPGTGERVALRIVARHADLWNMPGRPEALEPKLRVLDDCCREIDRDPRAIERSAYVVANLTDDPEEAKRTTRSWHGYEQPMIAGSAAALRGFVARYAELGVEHLMIADRTMGGSVEERKAGLDRFMEGVARRFREPGAGA